jgi:hypothetical protein
VKWEPPPDADMEVRHWMRSKGWTVTGSEYDYEQAVYTWQGHSTRSGHAPAVRISQQVLTDFPAFAVVEHLNRLRVADAIRRRPDAQYVVMQQGLEVTLVKASPSSGS